MSASKPVQNTKGCKPYTKPIFIELTPEAAKLALEARSIPGDEQAEKLLQAIKAQMEKR